MKSVCVFSIPVEIAGENTDRHEGNLEGWLPLSLFTLNAVSKNRYWIGDKLSVFSSMRKLFLT